MSNKILIGPSNLASHSIKMRRILRTFSSILLLFSPKRSLGALAAAEDHFQKQKTNQQPQQHEREDISGKPHPPLRSVTRQENKDTKRNFVSATLGSNMVLQRDVEAVLWGYSLQPGVVVTTRLVDANNKTNSSDEPLVFHTTAQGDEGLWRQKLPPQPASLQPVTIQIVCPATGQVATLTNIVFGDVYLCGGQSNMVFSLPGTTNGTREAALGKRYYPHVRIFTVGQDTDSTVPLPDLQTVKQPWTSVASPKNNSNSLWGNGDFDYFSSVCWFFGRTIADGLDNHVPIGLISSNWGGTRVELWQPGGNLYNAMIYPFMVGPMALTGFAWYQGEANARGQEEADRYAQNFPDMIQGWRRGFAIPDAYFGFVQISTWCPSDVDPFSVPQLRQAQMAALQLEGKIGYVTNADRGDGCNIHPPQKQYCGIRLGKSALSLQHGKPIHWKSPSYESVTTIAINNEFGFPSVVIKLKDVGSQGLYLLETPYNLNPPEPFSCHKKKTGICAGAKLLLQNQGWVDASITIQDDIQVVLTATNGEPHDSILASAYGWGSVPLMTVYDRETDLPVLPWNETLQPIPLAAQQWSPSKMLQ